MKLVPGILHLERAQERSRLHLLVHLNYSGPEFHPDNRKKTIIKREGLFTVYTINSSTVLTRSKTRENSGVLRVFSGSAGLRVNCSSVSGGTCLMKKYLKAEKAEKTSKQGLFLLHFLRSGSLKYVRINQVSIRAVQ